MLLAYRTGIGSLLYCTTHLSTASHKQSPAQECAQNSECECAKKWFRAAAVCLLFIYCFGKAKHQRAYCNYTQNKEPVKSYTNQVFDRLLGTLHGSRVEVQLTSGAHTAPCSPGRLKRRAPWQQARHPPHLMSVREPGDPNSLFLFFLHFTPVAALRTNVK